MASETTNPRPSTAPWYRHPVVTCTLIGALIGIFMADTRERLPGEEAPFLGPWVAIIYAEMGFFLGVAKAGLDGLPIGRFLAAILLAQLAGLIAIFLVF